MQYGYLDWLWGKVYPEVGWAEQQALRQYWLLFYENPEKYKGSQLEKLAFEWLETEEGQKEVKEWQDGRRF